MDADRFFNEMETAYRKAIEPYAKERPPDYFTVENGTSYYEVDRELYIRKIRNKKL